MTERRELEQLIRRLEAKHTYLSLRRNVKYDTGLYAGEFDVLGVRRNGTMVYYEHKCRDKPKLRDKALTQFARAQKAFPEFRWRFVYHTPQLTRLYTIGGKR